MPTLRWRNGRRMLYRGKRITEMPILGGVFQALFSGYAPGATPGPDRREGPEGFPHDQCHFGSRAYLNLTPSQSVRPSRRGVRRTKFVLYKSQTSPLKETKVSSRPDKGYPTFESFHPLSAGDFCLQILSNSTTHPISGPAGTTLKRSRAAPCPSGWMRHSNASPTRVALPMPWVKWPRQMAGLLRYLTTSW